MTQIFEALENAGLEKYNSKDQGRKSGPPPQQEEKVSSPLVSATKIKKRLNYTGLEKTVNNLYQNVVTMLPDSQCRVVQFQGTRPGEGTSTLVREFVKIAAFRLKKKVLLLDLNRDGLNQSSYFKLRTKSSEQVSENDRKVNNVKISRVKNTSLYMSEIKGVDGQSGKLLCELPEIDRLMGKLKKQFDFIVVDAPATMGGAECIMFSSSVDGIVLVVEAGKTRWQTVSRVKEKIVAQNGNILGVVLNKRDYPIPDFIYNRI